MTMTQKTIGHVLPSLMHQMTRQFIIDDLVKRLREEKGLDWSDVTGTDSADPTSVEPPTNEEIRQVQAFLGDRPEVEPVKFIIEDWAGNRLHPHKSFDTLDEGWEYVREHAPEECWQDIYVVHEKE